ncbi:helix-turn-helix domain-containing protein [Bifidobacterium crudilactis]|jgi:transcriptional regulator with XRE-family HTH domain|uniref:helix-turn-helix domain-containing protein n=1 Tax=Bifidobacterium crudilactis TaxID=327277 RepID=UPI0026475F0D|nr:helix-turn-helix domain-containing protein [Bifidobacterium crudilactis]MDN5973022.1 helix-turn-helix domain-containing protein [Bifidobacterium crudilactis]MDN6000986.1 helix-turn-helix domain-containing protein [Bifidobacterium crudilactis]MDN6209188.1 helix-turn-helix domain-containing protein [Bifidobacterium crudilactis]MDN6467680.1 helix-turn-helix domain-containing protein [Bifidobacterium crudilactis]MDN6558380.1 helix-turn-helix domain-containing protein [Bifidobacterium crudilacti
MFNLGLYIKKKRNALGLSQKKLGQLCQISDASIQRIEIGETKQPGWGILCKISNALDIHPFEILKEAGYITDDDISPVCKLNGLNYLDSGDLQSVQVYIDFIIFKKNNNHDQKGDSNHVL